MNQLMGLVEVNWPNAFKGLTGNEKKSAFSLWYLALQDIPAKVAALAVVKLAATSKFTPTRRWQMLRERQGRFRRASLLVFGLTTRAKRMRKCYLHCSSSTTLARL